VIKAILNWLTTGALDRVLDTVDRKLEADTDKEKIKADLITTAYQERAGFMRAGGFVLMLLFAVPLAFWFAAVAVYSVLWCAGCAFPQDWSVAALPPPLDEWGGWIVIAIFGVIGVTGRK
jgi:hypothetical protein